jgi:hypothetical protein
LPTLTLLGAWLNENTSGLRQYLSKSRRLDNVTQ